MNLTRSQLLLAGLLFLTIILYGYHYFAHRVSTDNAYLKANSVHLSAKLGGFIDAIYVKDNELVQKGTPLFAIDKTDYQIKVRQAEAAVSAQSALYQSLQQQEVLQKNFIDEANAGISASQATLNEAGKNLARAKKLHASGVGSDHLLDAATSKAQTAQSSTTQAMAKSQAAMEQLTIIRSKQKEAAAQLEQAEASLALARQQLSDTVISAPFTGIVTHRGVSVGQFIQPGFTVATLLDQAHIWLEANFKENQISAIRPGQKAIVTVDAYPKIQFTGIVDSLSPATGAEFSLLPAENATGNFSKIVQRVPVKITLKNPVDKLALLKAGLSTVVTIQIP